MVRRVPRLPLHRLWLVHQTSAAALVVLTGRTTWPTAQYRTPRSCWWSWTKFNSNSSSSSSSHLTMDLSCKKRLCWVRDNVVGIAVRDWLCLWCKPSQSLYRWRTQRESRLCSRWGWWRDYRRRSIDERAMPTIEERNDGRWNTRSRGGRNTVRRKTETRNSNIYTRILSPSLPKLPKQIKKRAFLKLKSTLLFLPLCNSSNDVIITNIIRDAPQMVAKRENS